MPCLYSRFLPRYVSFLAPEIKDGFQLLFFFFFYGLTLCLWKFLGQGLNLSHSCSNSRSLTQLCRARDGTRTSAATPATELGFLTTCTTAGTPWISTFNKKNAILLCQHPSPSPTPPTPKSHFLVVSHLAALSVVLKQKRVSCHK